MYIILFSERTCSFAQWKGRCVKTKACKADKAFSVPCPALSSQCQKKRPVCCFTLATQPPVSVCYPPRIDTTRPPRIDTTKPPRFDTTRPSGGDTTTEPKCPEPKKCPTEGKS